MIAFLRTIATNIKDGFEQSEEILDISKRIPSKIIFQALRSIRQQLTERFGDPITCRYPGHTHEDSLSGTTPYKVIEYLLDFSYSRYAIPDAIGDPRSNPIPNDQKFELIFTAESELGTDNEICRDLLKLLDTRSKIRCLLFPKRKKPDHNDRLKDRLMNVFKFHAHFADTKDSWLFIALEKHEQKVKPTFWTLNENYTGFTEIQP